MKTELAFLSGAAIGIVVAAAVVALFAFGVIEIEPAGAAGGQVKSPTDEAPDRYVYYPGTEKLAEDEIRVIACGTGMPAARRGQAAGFGT